MRSRTARLWTCKRHCRMPARTGLAEAASRCPRERIFQRIKLVLSLAQSRTQRHDVRGQAWSSIRVVVETKLMFDVTPRTWHMSRHSVAFVALVLYFFPSSKTLLLAYILHRPRTAPSTTSKMSSTLPPLSVSILGVEPMDEFILEIADFIHHTIMTRPSDHNLGA